MKTFQRRKTFLICVVCIGILFFLMGRLVYLTVYCSSEYLSLAQDLHERERPIKAERGKILDRNGVILADNKTVCTISVIHSQVSDPELVIQQLTQELQLPESYVRKQVNKVSSMERIQSNVKKEVGDSIRKLKLLGVKVDEDYKRFYPYDDLASKVLGFTGGDNQGIIGLEVKYDSYLQGKSGRILTITDAKGVEIKGAGERRIDPVPGKNLQISMDLNIQMYATQLAKQAYETKQAKGVSILVMKVKTGEILAMVDVPEFHLNDPFTLIPEMIPQEEPEPAENVVQTQAVLQTMTAQQPLSGKEYQDALNQMWRNGCINDTYEPGSTFKIITAAAGLEEGVVHLEDTFSCPGFIVVDDRRIRCHKAGGHGAETFVQATMNSCNPVFITVGTRLGAERYYHYFKQFGLLNKTGIDLPGEASTIMHKLENIGPVELATISFGQSFQITPIQLMTTAASIINNGTRVTPHFGIQASDRAETDISRFSYQETTGLLTDETSEKMRYILEQVVAEGGGKNGYVEGFRVGGKTATSQTLPRGTGKYISSFIAFAPADDPEIIAMAIIDTPQGVYYGGQIAAPIIRQLYENILPYLSGKDYNSTKSMKMAERS